MDVLRPSSAAERRLLQEGRLAGPMPWVIAIMMFLTLLASAAGLSVAEWARAMRQDLAGRITIQLIDANPVTREAQLRAIVREVGRLANVTEVVAVPRERLGEMLTPWLGDAGFESDLPVPALVDVQLRRATPQALAEVRSVVRATAPAARVTEQLDWLAPLADLLGTLTWIAAAIVMLMLGATAAIVVLAARASLNTHRATIDVLHLLGASDQQVATLFQRRIALDALFGGGIAIVAAIPVFLLVGRRIGDLAVGGAGEPVLLGWTDWAVLALLPLVGMALATVVARLTVLRALAKIL